MRFTHFSFSTFVLGMVFVLSNGVVLGQDATIPDATDVAAPNLNTDAVIPNVATIEPAADAPETPVDPTLVREKLSGGFNRMFLAPLLALLAGVLILVDYLMPTGWPAHLAYIVFGVCVYLAFDNVVYGLVTWLVLAVLHRLVFWKFLANADAPDAPVATE